MTHRSLITTGAICAVLAAICCATTGASDIGSML
jgi:hypothetical protein